MNKSILKTTALTAILVMAGAATTGCATKGFVRDQVAVVDGRVTTVEGTAGEALSRANAAHKLAEGKFHYQVVLSDDSVKFPTDRHALSPEAEARLTELAERLKGENKNVYLEIQGFTDATGDLESCELAALAGFSGNWLAGASAVILFNERFMQTAVRHQVDMIFTLEAFCGHGFRADDPAGQCYRGPDTETWFDLTCIHPTPVGHRVIADMFLAVIDE